MSLSSCQCEHTAHTEHTMTPNGNTGHRYGVSFFPHFLVSVKTKYGTFQVCNDCRNDCFQDQKEEKE